MIVSELHEAASEVTGTVQVWHGHGHEAIYNDGICITHVNRTVFECPQVFIVRVIGWKRWVLIQVLEVRRMAATARVE